jgi:hypothetical protein
MISQNRVTKPNKYINPFDLDGAFATPAASIQRFDLQPD